MDRVATRTILFLDGRDLSLDLENTFLARPECRIVLASPELEPLDAVQRERPDLLVIEVRASRTAGLRVCRALKADPALRRIPVLLLSTPTLRDEARRAGADAIVFIPLVQREFLAIVRRLVPIATRREPRCPVHLRVTLGDGGEAIQVHSRDLSERGMSLTASRHPAPGTGIRLRFALGGGEREIECGAVGRGPREPGGAPGGFAVEFDSIDPRDRERIGRFVSERLARPVEPS